VGGDLGAVFAFRDLRYQLRLEERLEHLAAMPEESPNPIVELDAQANLLYANATMMALMGAHGFHPSGGPAVLPETLRRIAHECLWSGASRTGIEVVVDSRHYIWSFFPSPEQGSLRGYGIDLTEQKQAELDMKRVLDAAVDVSRVKAGFLANVSHELRTPLNGIVGMTELALATDPSPEQREYLEAVQESASVLSTLINDILDFSKIEAGKLDLQPVCFSFRQSLRGTLRVVAPRAFQKGVELLCDVPPEVPDMVIGDPNRLRQIVMNLVDNAIKFTTQGEVVVRVSVAEQLHQHVRITFTVQDTGIGIPLEKQRSIFEPFTQADSSTTRLYGGTGLGLTIAMQLVTMMQGTIGVESAGAGLGSTFRFDVCFALPGQPAPPPVTLPEHLWNKSVLVIDENATSLGLLIETLRANHLHAVAVGDVPAALGILEGACGTDEAFPILIMNSSMTPVDHRGIAQLLDTWPELSVVLFITAGQGSVDTADRVVTVMKPVLQVDVVEAIRRLVDAAVAPPAAIEGQSDPLTPRESLALRILLAEDNAINQKLVQRLLEKQGHEVVVVGDGSAALNMLREETFDLVLLDLQMPAMNGIEVARTLRSWPETSGAYVPIVAITAHASHADRERCLQAGMDGYVSKPIQIADLFETIARVTPSHTQHAAQPTSSVRWADVLDYGGLLTRVNGDIALLQELVTLFLEDYAQRLACIEDAVTRADWQELGRVLHALKGTVGNFAAHAVLEVILRFEAALVTGKLRTIAGVHTALVEELERLKKALTELVKVRMAHDSDQ
jgi:signal transduction histidine kinase/CheY-like chemotaxis protein